MCLFWRTKFSFYIFFSTLIDAFKFSSITIVHFSSLVTVYSEVVSIIDNRAFKQMTAVTSVLLSDSLFFCVAWSRILILWFVALDLEGEVWLFHVEAWSRDWLPGERSRDWLPVEVLKCLPSLVTTSSLRPEVVCNHFNLWGDIKRI